MEVALMNVVAVLWHCLCTHGLLEFFGTFTFFFFFFVVVIEMYRLVKLILKLVCRNTAVNYNRKYF